MPRSESQPSPPLCYCGTPAQGAVPPGQDWPAHWCQQCGPEHCLIAEHFRGRSAGGLRTI